MASDEKTKSPDTGNATAENARTARNSEDLDKTMFALSCLIADVKNLACGPTTPERAKHMSHLADCGRFLLEAISFLDD